jgi:hypothetical protein
MQIPKPCIKCGSGPVQQVIESWGPLGVYVYFACSCGCEIYDPRPLHSAEEGNWPNLLEIQQEKP